MSSVKYYILYGFDLLNTTYRQSQEKEKNNLKKMKKTNGFYILWYKGRKIFFLQKKLNFDLYKIFGFNNQNLKKLPSFS